MEKNFKSKEGNGYSIVIVNKGIYCYFHKISLSVIYVKNLLLQIQMGKCSISFALYLNSWMYPKVRIMCVCQREMCFPSSRGSRIEIYFKSFASFCNHVVLLFKFKSKSYSCFDMTRKVIFSCLILCHYFSISKSFYCTCTWSFTV